MNRSPTPLSPYYRSLTRNMVIVIILISFTPMVLVTGIILDHFSASHHEKVFAHLEELVLKHVRFGQAALAEKMILERPCAITYFTRSFGHSR